MDARSVESNWIKELRPALFNEAIKAVRCVLLEMRRVAVSFKSGLIFILFVNHINPRILAGPLYDISDASRLTPSLFLELAK